MGDGGSTRITEGHRRVLLHVHLRKEPSSSSSSSSTGFGGQVEEEGDQGVGRADL